MYVGTDPVLFDNEDRAATLVVDSGSSVTYGYSRASAIGTLAVGRSAAIENPVWVAAIAGSAEVHVEFSTLPVGSASGGPTASKQLRWAPPAQINPTVVNLDTAFYSGTFGPNEDVILVMPATARVSALQTTGGRHIRIIGGKVTHGATGSALRFDDVVGSVFIEGVDIDMNGVNADAINVAGRLTGTLTYPDIYLQNVRAMGVTGSLATTHADVFQAQGPIGRLFMDKVTFGTDYQGIFIPKQFPITSAFLSRVNGYLVAGADSITYALWWQDSVAQAGGTLPYPITLDEVYVQPRTGQDLALNAVWPQSGQANIGAVTLADGSVRWPEKTMQVSGVVKPGAPSAGDWCAPGAVGLGYVSPGYQQTPLSPRTRLSALDVFRSSNCATVPRQVGLTQSANAVTSGRIEGAAAVCVEQDTFSKIAFITGGTAPVAPTVCRLGVWDYFTGAKLAETADFGANNPQAGAWALGTRYLADLSAALTLPEGAMVWLGLVYVGTSFQLRGSTGGVIAAAADDPPLTISKTGYTTGALPALTATGQISALHWLELRR